ncbi:hypothetical protein OAD49_00015 [Flavobacteriaceae bacterium]|nr:hypothetical protein [Flavobacteriaceae bacterium]
MSYNYTKEELYNWVLFNIDNNGQEVTVAFEPSEVEKCLMIIFCDSKEDITGYHEKEFWDTLYEIMNDFDNHRKLDYEIIAV